MKKRTKKLKIQFKTLKSNVDSKKRTLTSFVTNSHTSPVSCYSIVRITFLFFYPSY